MGGSDWIERYQYQQFSWTHQHVCCLFVESTITIRGHFKKCTIIIGLHVCAWWPIHSASRLTKTKAIYCKPLKELQVFCMTESSSCFFLFFFAVECVPKKATTTAVDRFFLRAPGTTWPRSNMDMAYATESGIPIPCKGYLHFSFRTCFFSTKKMLFFLKFWDIHYHLIQLPWMVTSHWSSMGVASKLDPWINWISLQRWLWNPYSLKWDDNS